VLLHIDISLLVGIMNAGM